MAEQASTDYNPDSFTDIFSQASSRLPDDTVFYSIFPDFSVSASTQLASEISSSLHSLHVDVIDFVASFTSSYIWQHEPFSLSTSLPSVSCVCSRNKLLPHLHGKLRYGDNLEDEWFVVFLLLRVSAAFPTVSIRAWDTDGEFLLIETAFHLPGWLNPDTSRNRVFIRGGDLHIVPKTRLADPSLVDSLRFLVQSPCESRASEPLQAAMKGRLTDYPERASKNMHRVRVRVPVSVAQVLKDEPCLISLAVEGFYDRDVDAMKHAAKMMRFLSKCRDEELVLIAVRMSRPMYAQLLQQRFQAPKCYPMPDRSDRETYMEAELGMKIACGFEMMYQQRKKEGERGKGSTWSKYKESLEASGYFEGLLPGSKAYKNLIEKAEGYYRKSSTFSRTREILSAPIRRIDEILAVPCTANEFKVQEVPPSDDHSWLYDGEDDLNAALEERQKEMEMYTSKVAKKLKSKEGKEAGTSSALKMDDFDLGDIAKAMQQFVDKMSSYEGAEVPEGRDAREVKLDADRFIKDVESFMGGQIREGDDDSNEEQSSSDMDFDEDDDDESELEEVSGSDGGGDFMPSYSGAMNEELKETTLKKSFIGVHGQPFQINEGASEGGGDEEKDEELAPVDVDLNLVKSLVDSFESQGGLPGPASNILGLMDVRLPKDSKMG